MFSLCVYIVGFSSYWLLPERVCSKLKVKESVQFMSLSRILVQKGSCLVDDFPDGE